MSNMYGCCECAGSQDHVSKLADWLSNSGGDAGKIAVSALSSQLAWLTALICAESHDRCFEHTPFADLSLPATELLNRHHAGEFCAFFAVDNLSFCYGSFTFTMQTLLS